MARGLGDYGILGTPNQCVNHPSGIQTYGTIPEMNCKGETLISGDIQLRIGDHYGPNNGFGIRHIWAEHEAEMRKLGYSSVNDVPEFVASVIVRGTPIYCEFESHRGNHNVTVLKSSIGSAILQPKRFRDTWIYSVVTVFSRKTPRGTLVGNVE